MGLDLSLVSQPWSEPLAIMRMYSPLTLPLLMPYKVVGDQRQCPEALLSLLLPGLLREGCAVVMVHFRPIPANHVNESQCTELGLILPPLEELQGSPHGRENRIRKYWQVVWGSGPLVCEASLHPLTCSCLTPEVTFLFRVYYHSVCLFYYLAGLTAPSLKTRPCWSHGCLKSHSQVFSFCPEPSFEWCMLSFHRLRRPCSRTQGARLPCPLLLETRVSILYLSCTNTSSSMGFLGYVTQTGCLSY